MTTALDIEDLRVAYLQHGDPKVAVDTAPVTLAPGAQTALQGLGAG